MCRDQSASDDQADPANPNHQQSCGGCRDGLRARQVGHENSLTHFLHWIDIFSSLAAALLKDAFRSSSGFSGACARAPTSAARRVCSGSLGIFFLLGFVAFRPQGAHLKKIAAVDFFVSLVGGSWRPRPGQRPPSPGHRTVFGIHQSASSKNLTRSR